MMKSLQLSVAAVFGFVPYAAGDVLVSNLAEPFRDASPVANPEFWCAQSFITDNNTYLLGSIDALVGNGLGKPDVVAELRSSDVNGEIDQTPAGLLTTLIAPDVSGEFSARPFIPATSVTLEPSLRYWLILGANSGTYDWGYANTNFYVGNGAIDVFADSSDAGATWIYRDLVFPYFIQVNVSATESQWNVDEDGDWSVSGNWIGGSPNAVDAVAAFGSIITTSRTVTVDSPQTVGQINFDNENAYAIAGSSQLTINGASSSIHSINGSHEISAPLMLVTDTTITVDGAALTISEIQPGTAGITKSGSGELVVNNVQQSSLTISAGSVRVIQNGSDSGTSRVTALALDGGATPSVTLDLDDNDLVVVGGNQAEIAGWISHARNAGTWDAPGITSSFARNHPSGSTTLGVLTGDEYLQVYGAGATFDGFEVDAADVLVKSTYYGDADFSGAVDFDDYVRTDTGFNTGLSGWLNGDFDFSGGVDFDDYVLIDNAFNTQNGTLIDAMNWLEGEDRSALNASRAGVRQVIDHYNQFGMEYVSAFYASVPEPAAAGVAALVATGLLRPRRRRNITC